MKRNVFGLVLLAIILFASLSWLPPIPGVNGSVAASATSESFSVVFIYYESFEELENLSAELDIWEVHPEEGYVVAWVDSSQMTSLSEKGFRVEVDAARSHYPETIPGFPCYRTITEVYARLDEIAAAYPNLVEKITIGYSYENRPLRVLKLTNKATSGTKPRFFVMANIHGRELITPETALVYIEYIVNNYGTSADITWLLDSQEIYVLASSNPDGHVKNEPGLPWTWWRKNVHPYGSCAPDSIGVDLNRNHSFKWTGSGSSTDPCDDTYRGPSEASEPETAVVQSYIRSLFPDQRGPGDTDPAPDTATGVMITLHSYSNLVLWPWGWTTTAAPNSTGLAALGRKMASFNGYTAQQSVGLYPTNGTTDDWSYGELGIASYTFEIGSSGDGFYPACSRYDALIQPNISALIYAAKVSRTPYLTSQGPDALNPLVSPQVVEGWPVLRATIDDSKNGNAVIMAAEYFIDTPPWAGGVAHAMQPQDGSFNMPVEVASSPLITSDLGLGRHIIYVRGRDASGFWGPVSAVFYTVTTNSKIQGTVSDSSSGDPLPGSSVSLRGPSMSLQVTTAEDGTYFAPVMNGTYTATVTHYGFYPLSVSGIVASVDITTTQDFSLDLLPNGVISGVVKELGSNLPLQATIVVTGTPLTTISDDLTGEFSLQAPVGSYTLIASAAGHANRVVQGVQVNPGVATSVEILLPPQACLLLVDDDFQSDPTTQLDYRPYYTTFLDKAGIDYLTWDVRTQSNPGSAVLAPYRAVLWYTGDASLFTLAAADQSALANYLANGGRLFLSGQNIAQDIYDNPGNFLGQVLHTSFVGDQGGQTSLSGGGLFAGEHLLLKWRGWR